MRISRCIAIANIKDDSQYVKMMGQSRYVVVTITQNDVVVNFVYKMNQLHICLKLHVCLWLTRILNRASTSFNVLQTVIKCYKLQCFTSCDKVLQASILIPASRFFPDSDYGSLEKYEPPSRRPSPA